MRLLLGLSRGVDALNERCGRLAEWCILAACAIAAANAMLRYGVNFSHNGWLEVQWYLFAAVVMLGAAHTLRLNGHVRVDVFYSSILNERGRVWLDVFGLLLFMLPAMALLAWMCWPFFLESLVRHEVSPAPGGLLRWPVKLLMPAGFALIALQGVSELVKRIAWLRGEAVPNLTLASTYRPDQ